MDSDTFYRDIWSRPFSQDILPMECTYEPRLSPETLKTMILFVSAIINYDKWEFRFSLVAMKSYWLRFWGIKSCIEAVKSQSDERYLSVSVHLNDLEVHPYLQTTIRSEPGSRSRMNGKCYPPTRLLNRFWNLSRLKREDCAAPAKILAVSSIFRLIWRL